MIFAIFVSVLGSLCYVYTSFYSTSMCSLCCCEYKHTHNGRGLSYVFFLGLRIVSFPPRAFLHTFGIRIRINCLECASNSDARSTRTIAGRNVRAWRCAQFASSFFFFFCFVGWRHFCSSVDPFLEIACTLNTPRVSQCPTAREWLQSI